MKIFTLLLFVLTISFISMAQDTLYLWPGNVPGETAPKHDPVQTPNTDRNVIRLTDVTNPALVIFKPEAAIKNGHSIIISPGGGYSILAIDLEGYEIARWLSSLGYTAYVLQYRVPDKQKKALDDLQRALRMVRKKSSPSGKVGVLGFSAGGSLSARASTRYGDEGYPKVDDQDLISCRPDFAVLIYPAYLDLGKDRSLTPELLVDKNIPPMFIFGTADDPYGNSALVMATALRDHAVPVELHFLSKGGHGYGMRNGNIAAETWPGLAEVWLKEIVKE